jgi:hypothetical protein
VQPNSAGTGTLALGGTYQQWNGSLHPVADLTQSIGLSNLRVAEMYGQHYYSYNGDYRSDLVAGTLTGNRIHSLPDASGSVVVTASVSHDYSGGTTAWTMTAAEAGASFFTVTNASGGVDAIFPATVPGKQFTVYNNSGRAITFKVTGQTGSATTDGKYSIWIMNALDCVKIYEQP